MIRAGSGASSSSMRGISRGAGGGGVTSFGFTGADLIGGVVVFGVGAIVGNWVPDDVEAPVPTDIESAEGLYGSKMNAGTGGGGGGG